MKMGYNTSKHSLFKSHSFSRLILLGAALIAAVSGDKTNSFPLEKIQDFYIYKDFDPSKKTVAIFTVPISENFDKKIKSKIEESETGGTEDKSFVPSSYAEWVYKANANVIIVPFELDLERLETILRLVNAVMLPGGATPLYDNEPKVIKIDVGYDKEPKKLSKFSIKESQIISVALKIIDQNPESLKIWGTCLGFEQLLLHFDPKLNFSIVLDKDVSREIEISEEFTDKFISLFGEEAKEALENNQLSYMNHHFALWEEDFLDNDNLIDAFRIIATSHVESPHPEKKIVAAIQGKKYPIFATQFHPEKNEFESKANATKSSQAFTVMEKFAIVFVNSLSEANKSNNELLSQSEPEDKVNHIFKIVENVSKFQEIIVDSFRI